MPSDAPKAAGRAPLRLAASYLVLVVLAAFVLFPVYMTLVRALSTPIAHIEAGNPPYPVEPQWDVFRRAIDQGDLLGAAGRSFVMTLVITAAQVLTSCLAAYAFVFLRFPAKRVVFALFMATLMIPIEVTIVANTQFVRQIGWNDTLQGLVAPFLATALGTFLIRQGFSGVPDEIRDATRLDGYGHLRFLFRIAIPLTRPVIASFTVISFLAAWNQYLWPRSIIDSEGQQTLQIALPRLAATSVGSSNVIVAGALLAGVPILFLLIFFQRHIVRGLTAGAVKG